MPAVTVRFAAMTPPNAETGSQAWALAWASAMGSAASAEPTATPHGLACLMMATAGSAEVEGGAEGGVGVHEVVVAHGLAVQLVRLGDAGRGGLVHVQGSLLVRVFAVAEDLGAFQGQAGVGGPVDDAVAVLIEELAGSPGGHGVVVGRGVRERLGGEAAAGLQVEAAFSGGACTTWP